MEESPNALSFELGNELSVPNNEPKLLDYIEQFQPREINSGGSDMGMQDFDPTANFMSTIKGPSIEAQAQSIAFNPQEKQLDRYTNSTYYGQLGFDPRINNEEAYASYQTWGDMFSNAFAGAGKLASGTFVEGWKGWGRLSEALGTWDSSKLTASNEEMYEMAKQQEDIMNKYAIFKSAESEQTVINKQFFGDLVQNSGFAVGAIAQFASEELLTFGAATIFSATKLGIRTIEGINQLQNIAEFKKLHQSLGAIWKEKGLMETLYQGARRTIPLVNTVEKFNIARKAGAGAAQLGYIGLGGVRRVMSEYNMARSEAIFEASGTYKELKDKLVNEHMNATGEMPDGAQMERIDALSRNGAVDNFTVNMGLLLVSNRLQFDNMLGKFSLDRRIFKQAGAQYADDFFTVTGKAAAKEGEEAVQKSVTNIYRKGTLGELSALGEVAKDFGTKRAVWEGAKAVGRTTFKWETSEGLQELFQEASNKGLQDFYYNLYHGKKGFTGKTDAILKSVQNPFTDVQGAKTFLMGAVTGRLLSPINYTMGKVAERATTTAEQRTAIEADKVEALKVSRAFYSNPYSVIKEEIKNFKVQDTAAKTMEAAVGNRDKYFYENAKGSAFASAVSYAKKTGTLDAMLDTIREYGNRLTPEEVKEAFNIDPSEDNVASTKEYFGKIADSVEDFQKNWDRLQDKFGNRIMPELYAEGSDAKKQAQLRKFALDNYIEILATNSYKSKEATKRAYEIYTQVSSNQNIGSSASYAFKTLANERAFTTEISLLTEELKSLKGVENQTADQKALIDAKEAQLEALKKWKDNWSTLIFDQKNQALAQVYVVKKAFEKYVNAKNAESKIDATITRDDIDDTYVSFIDYIKLNQDADQYTEAYNFIADPVNSEKYIERIGSALDAAQRRLVTDALNELFSAQDAVTPTDEDLADLSIDQDELATDDELAEAVAADFDPSELESELQAKYQELVADKIANNELLQPKQFLKYNNFAAEILAKYGIDRTNIKPSIEIVTEDNYKDVEFIYNGEQYAPNPPGTSTEVTTPTPVADESGVPADTTETEVGTQQGESTETNEGNPNKTFKVGKYTLTIGDKVIPKDDPENELEVKGYSPSAVVLQEGNDSSLNIPNDVFEQYVDAGDLIIKTGVNTNAPTPVTNVPKPNTTTQDAPDFTNINTTLGSETWNDEKGNDITTNPKAVQASGKINNASDKVVVEQVGKRQVIKRDGRNNKYPAILGTSAINVGTPITVRVDVGIEDYDDVDYANNTSTKKTAQDFFGPDGKILETALNDFPVAIYTTVNGKEVKLGYLPTMQWVTARYSNGQTQHIVETIKIGDVTINNLEEQIEALADQRKAIFDAHNNNPGVALDAVVTSKTVGMLRLSTQFQPLSDIVSPSTQLGIIRGGKVMTDFDVELTDEDVFMPFSAKSEDGENVIDDQYNGWPVMMIPTPTGQTLVSWVGVSKLKREHSTLMLEAWKAFHKLAADNQAGKEHKKSSKEYKLVNAVYNALGTSLMVNETPMFTVLKEYLNSYVTFMSGSPYNKIRTGYGLGNIGNNGELIVWSVMSQDQNKDLLKLSDPSKLTKETEEQFYTIASNLYYNVKFTGENAEGLNSKKKIGFLSVEDGKVKVTAPKTYNEYMFDNLYTNLENGLPVDEKNPNSERVHFANPVVNFDFTGTEVKPEQKAQPATEVVEEPAQEPKKRSTPEEIDAAFAALTKESADLEIRRNALPESQSNTRSAATVQVLDYFAEVEGINKFDESLDKGTYIPWLQNTSPLGYEVSNMLNNPRAAFDLITKEAEKRKAASKEAEKPVEAPKKSITDIASLLASTNFAEGIESLGADDLFRPDEDKQLKSAKTTVENLKQDNTLKKDCK